MGVDVVVVDAGAIIIVVAGVVGMERGCDFCPDGVEEVGVAEYVGEDPVAEAVDVDVRSVWG